LATRLVTVFFYPPPFVDAIYMLYGCIWDVFLPIAMLVFWLWLYVLAFLQLFLAQNVVLAV